MRRAICPGRSKTASKAFCGFLRNLWREVQLLLRRRSQGALPPSLMASRLAVWSASSAALPHGFIDPSAGSGSRTVAIASGDEDALVRQQCRG